MVGLFPMLSMAPIPRMLHAMRRRGAVSVKALDLFMVFVMFLDPPSGRCAAQKEPSEGEDQLCIVETVQGAYQIRRGAILGLYICAYGCLKTETMIGLGGAMLVEGTHRRNPFEETSPIPLIIKSTLPQPGGTLARRSGRASRRTMLSSRELTNRGGGGRPRRVNNGKTARRLPGCADQESATLRPRSVRPVTPCLSHELSPAITTVGFAFRDSGEMALNSAVKWVTGPIIGAQEQRRSPARHH